MEKLYSVFLYVLLISLLFFPLTSAGRVLLDKPQKADDESGKHSNGGNKIGVEGSHSSPAHSATGHSSPFHATPSSANKPLTATSGIPNRVACGQGDPNSVCGQQTRLNRSCSQFKRIC
ncbi:uncharacterized protein LOC104878923 isoform X1 [Vitis vinifera]|uniref:uncharacterized protein LOC104878923 isoform X1 n=1 Tax=Vitis vinifera TaxID=29760 RepID=UPI00053F9D90|nr:uncharacterized protein LOC104878923 isoform X1 [Vitis vinifera]|eukprot:XP_010648170.1 PREDICTED: uncharacterized protein LOC104878923 isoform X1 [Vitis vinifera]